MYNEFLIREVIDQFITVYSKDGAPITILFDADNTLYHYSTYKRVEESKREMYYKGFYHNLPVYPEAPVVVENLQRFGLTVGILSATIDSPFCRPEKLASFAYHFPTISPDNIFLCEQGIDKSTVVGDVRHTILVDDYHGNINQWYQAGGVAIKKSYSGKKRPVPVVTSLVDLFYVLHTLNVI